MSKALKFLALFAVAAGLQFVASGSAQAGFLASILTNGENTFEDQDREAFVDVDGDDLFGEGDVLLGFVRLDDKLPASGGVGPINNRIYAIFSQQVSLVTPIAPAAGIYQIDFEATTAAGLTLSELIGEAAPVGSVVAVYSDTTAITDLVLNSPGDLTGNGTTNLFDYFAEITGNMGLDLIAGFGSGATEGDDYFTAFTNGAGGALVTGSVAGIPAIPSGVTVANFTAGLSILLNNDTNVVYNEQVVSFNPTLGIFTLHDLAIANGAVRGTAGTTNAAEWGNTNPDVAFSNPGGFSTDADFFVNATVVPEPSSLALFSLGLGALGAVRAFRRRKSSDA